MLTNNIDTEHEILLNMDITTLRNYCMINKNKVCNDDFWYRKFKQDDKIIHFQPKTLHEWITMYKYNQYKFHDLKQIKVYEKFAKDIITICKADNRLAYNNLYVINKNKYSLFQYIEQDYEYSEDEDFSDVYKNYKYIQFKFKDNHYYILFYIVQYNIDDEEYENIDETSFEDGDYEIYYRLTITKEQFITYLTVILIDLNYSDIKDIDGVSFIESFLLSDVPEDAHRLGMWKMLKYLSSQ
jgi:hypothetical protein